MKPERWQQIERILDGALQREGSERKAFLDEACSGEASLRQEVESLLEASERAESFIEAPALEEAAKAMAQNQVQSLVGQELGPYRILSLLGTGGMGEVYLAQDSKLDRKVALKFMTQEMQLDEAARKRFLREARSAAALDHPHVCSIFEIGEAEGKDFISMQYIEGETLKDQLERGPLPLQEALEKATEIARAMEAAHRQKIIHRDLKPSNIMITPDGHVKVLDFGLAKRLDPADETGDRREKTLTANLTQTGDTLGTVPYMSPEQLRWQAADARSDIFSFGVLLYEMITGIHPFRKHSPAETANAVLSQDPAPLTRYLEGIPELLQHTVRKMLAKEPDQRYQSVKGLLVDLEQLKRDLDWEKAAVPASAPAVKAKLRRRIVWGVALLSSVLMAGIAVWLLLSPSRTPEVSLEALPLTTSPGREHYPAFSPDGNQVAFSWNGDPQENFDLYVKLIGGGRPLRLTTDPADDISPSWSPDGRSIAFLRVLPAAKSAIFLIPALGGPERKVAEINLRPGPTFNYPNSFLGWYPDGNWLIVSNAEEGSIEPVGLSLLSIGTGEKRRLTFPPIATTLTDLDPVVSPDGHTLVFTRMFSAGVSDLFLLELSPEPGPKGEPKRLTSRKLQSTSPHWTADGEEILFSSGGFRGNRSLWKIAVSGSGQPQRLAALDPETARFVISHQANRLVYVRELVNSNIWRFKVPGPGGRIRRPSRFITSSRSDMGGQFSPNGSKIVFGSNRSGSFEIWVCDSDGSNAIQLTSFGDPIAMSPSWSPDGERIVFEARVEGTPDLYVMNAIGGTPQRLTTDPAWDGGPSWSRDGRWIYFSSNRSGEHDLWKVPASGGTPIPVTRGAGKGGYVWAPFESPDGEFLYYVKSLPQGGDLWKVPVEGGAESQVLESIRAFAIWDQGIYFLQNDALHSLSFESGEIQKIAEIEDPRIRRLGASSPDGQWILFGQLGGQLDQNESDLMLVDNFR